MGILTKTVKIWLIVVLMSSVLFVFVCPDLDLEPSALRAMRLALLFFLALVFPGVLMSGHFAPTAVVRPPSVEEPPQSLAADLQSFTCTRLC